MEETTSLEKKKLPGSIGTLTVLTFIGSGIGLITYCMNYFRADKAVAEMEAARDNPDTPAFVKSMMTPEAIEQARLAAANKLPLTILNLIAVALCVAGAIQMRKLKKDGYIMWLIGELLPFIATIILIGTGSFTGIPFYVATGIVALFIILYTTQYKYLQK